MYRNIFSTSVLLTNYKTKNVYWGTWNNLEGERKKKDDALSFNLFCCKCTSSLNPAGMQNTCVSVCVCVCVCLWPISPGRFMLVMLMLCVCVCVCVCVCEGVGGGRAVGASLLG